MTLNELFWIGILGLLIYQTDRLTKTQAWEALKSYLLIGFIAAILFVIGFWIALI